MTPSPPPSSSMNATSRLVGLLICARMARESSMKCVWRRMGVNSNESVLARGSKTILRRAALASKLAMDQRTEEGVSGRRSCELSTRSMKCGQWWTRLWGLGLEKSEDVLRVPVALCRYAQRDEMGRRRESEVGVSRDAEDNEDEDVG